MLKYLNKKSKHGSAVHIWFDSQDDTACRMWSTGGMSKRGHEIVDSAPAGKRICSLCLGAVSRGVKKTKNIRPATRPHSHGVKATPAPVVISATATKVWTDGSCYPNPGPGGWAWHDGDLSEQGGEVATTNNRMELMAILRAMEAFPAGTELAIHSDSQYCVNGLTIWSASWRKGNWMRKDGPLANRDLWLLLERQKERTKSSFIWVRGHDGDAGNERADALAEEARRRTAGEID